MLKIDMMKGFQLMMTIQSELMSHERGKVCILG
jgi:hypothetical protein